MSIAQWILNCTLLGWVLSRNLGTRPVTRSTFLVPAAVVVAAAVAFLRHVPILGHDLQLELVGAAAGAVLGGAAAALTQVRHRGDRIVVTAGVWFVVLWVVVIGGRVAFAEWATRGGARTIGEFSMRHQITGADAWTAAFVLMALAMVLVRYVATGVLATTVARRTPVPDLASVA